MEGFLKLVSPNSALKLFSDAISGIINDSIEIVPTLHSFDRIIAENIIAPHSLPSFIRSTVDGFAVRSKDTYGSSDTNPTYLEIVGEVLMGTESPIIFHSGQAVIIHTGGMIPVDADAVVMVEDSQRINESEIEVYRAVSQGENVLAIGEDIQEGEICISAGTKIRTVEIGGLLALGIMEIPVKVKPKVAIISSGDEIINPSNDVKGGQVRDINSYLLSASITNWGGIPVRYGIVPDNLDKLLEISRKAFGECDIVVFTAGSSVSIRDITANAIKSLGEPGVLIHGVNIRPGKPTILAICADKPVIGLPGNPVSAFVTSNIFVRKAIQQWLGFNNPIQPKELIAILETNIPSKTGREDWVPVKIRESNERLLAQPIFSRSNYIFSLVSSDGLICIPPDKTGLNAGDEVIIHSIE